MNKYINIKKSFIVSQVVLTIITLFITFIATERNLKIIEIIFLMQIIFSFIICSDFFTDIINIFTLFLFNFFLFNAGRVCLSIFNLGEYNKITWFALYDVEAKVSLMVVFILMLSLQGLTWGYIIFYKKTTCKLLFEEKFSLFKIGQKIFVYSSIFAFIRVFNMLYITLNNGYMSYYSEEYKISILFSISDDIFKFSLFIILISNMKWTYIKKYIFIYVGYLIILIFTGFRGMALSEILMIILYIRIKNRSLLNLKKLSVIFISLVIIIFFVGSIRMGENPFRDINKRDNIIVDLIQEQGFSLNVLNLVVEDNKNNFTTNTFEYIMYPLKSLFTNKHDYISKVEEKSLPHKISYVTNEYIYLSGGGLGGNYLAELYIAGGLYSMFFLNLLIGYGISKMNNLLKKRYGLYIFLVITPTILMMSRDYTIGFIGILPKAIIFLIAVYIILKRNKI